jgi:molecular chaperone HscB
LNKAYITLKSPLTRAQYLLELHGIDLTNETGTQEYTDQATLFDVLDIHESLESIDDEEELTKYKQENDERIKESVKKLEELFGSEQWDQAARECIKLKYWMNIDNAVKNWDGGVSPLIH